MWSDLFHSLCTGHLPHDGLYIWYLKQTKGIGVLLAWQNINTPALHSVKTPSLEISVANTIVFVFFSFTASLFYSIKFFFTLMDLLIILQTPGFSDLKDTSFLATLELKNTFWHFLTRLFLLVFRFFKWKTQ